MSRRLIVVMMIVSVGTTGCMVGPKYQRPKGQTPAVYRGVANPAARPDPQTLADSKWFEVFKYNQLQQLIREALTSNYDLREAVARVDAARANYGITRSDQFPSIAAGSSLTTVRNSAGGAFPLPRGFNQDRTFGSLALNLVSFEADIWGRLRNATEASRADLLAADENRK